MTLGSTRHLFPLALLSVLCLLGCSDGETPPKSPVDAAADVKSEASDGAKDVDTPDHDAGSDAMDD